MLRPLMRMPRSLLAITVGRLALVPVIVLSFDEQPAVTTATLAIFIAVDLYDGVLARHHGADDTARRTLDTAVDRISIWTVYLAVAAGGYLAIPLLALFGLRELYTGYWCQRLLLERDVVIRADWMYRGLNLTLAGWVVAAPFLSSSERDALFVGVLLGSAVVARDASRSLRCVLHMPSSVRSMVIPAGELRSLRSSQASSSAVMSSPRSARHDGHGVDTQRVRFAPGR